MSLERAARQRNKKDDALLAALKEVGITDIKLPTGEPEAVKEPESPVKPPKDEAVVEATPVKRGRKKAPAATPKSTRKTRKRQFPEANP